MSASMGPDQLPDPDMELLQKQSKKQAAKIRNLLSKPLEVCRKLYMPQRLCDVEIGIDVCRD